jgi:hypothetical protein
MSQAIRASLIVGTIAAGLLACMVPVAAARMATSKPATDVRVIKPPRTDGLSAIGCFATTCVAAGGQTVVTVKAGKPSAGQRVSGTTFLHGAACATATWCIAVGEYDSVTTGPWDGTTGEGNGSEVGVIVPVVGGVARPAVVLPSMITVYAVACPAVSRCLVAGQTEPPGGGDWNTPTGGLITLKNGTPGLTQTIAGTEQITSIACYASTRCLAVADTIPSVQGGLSTTGIVPVDNGIAGRVSRLPELHTHGVPSGLTNIACATPSVCLGVGPLSDLVITGGVAARWILAPSTLAGAYGPVACETSTACVTVDPLGESDIYAVDTDGTVGPASYLPLYSIGGVACWSPTNCAAAGSYLGVLNGAQTELGALADFSPPTIAAGSHPPRPRCTVPDVRGIVLSGARSLIKEALCKVGAITHRRAAAPLRGRVLSETPHAGSVRPQGTRVNLVLGS